MGGIGRILIYLGLFLVIVGIAFMFIGKIPWLGHLPGDITIERERFTFYFPLATCLIISVVLSLVLYLLRR
jgi:hypothetical protein